AWKRTKPLASNCWSRDELAESGYTANHGVQDKLYGPDSTAPNPHDLARRASSLSPFGPRSIKTTRASASRLEPTGHSFWLVPAQVKSATEPLDRRPASHPEPLSKRDTTHTLGDK